MNSRGAMLAQAARGPVLLIVIGVLFAMQQAGVLGFSRSWPLLIIVIGVMKLLERLAVGQSVQPPAPPPPPPFQQPPPLSGGPYAGPGSYSGSNYRGGAQR